MLHWGTVVGVFKSNMVPKQDLDFLSSDMDSHDIFVLEAILEAGYKPSVISIKYNKNWPVAVSASLVDPHLTQSARVQRMFTGSGCVWGASATALRELLEAHEYQLAWVTPGLDLIWVASALVERYFYVPSFEYFVPLMKLGSFVNCAYPARKHMNEILDYATWRRTRNVTAALTSFGNSIHLAKARSAGAPVNSFGPCVQRLLASDYSDTDNKKCRAQYKK